MSGGSPFQIHSEYSGVRILSDTRRYLCAAHTLPVYLTNTYTSCTITVLALQVTVVERWKETCLKPTCGLFFFSSSSFVDFTTLSLVHSHSTYNSLTAKMFLFFSEPTIDSDFLFFPCTPFITHESTCKTETDT